MCKVDDYVYANWSICILVILNIVVRVNDSYGNGVLQVFYPTRSS